MLTVPPTSQKPDDNDEPDHSRALAPIPLLTEAREAGVDHDLLVAAASLALRRRFPTGLPLWWTLLASSTICAGEPWPIESLRVEPFFCGYFKVLVRAMLNTVDKTIGRDDLLRILANTFTRQVLASSPDVRIEPISCGFNLLHPDGTGAFLGGRFDAFASADARVSAITKSLNDLAGRRGVTVHVKRSWAKVHAVVDYDFRVFGYQHAMHRLTVAVTGAAQDTAAGRQLRAEIVDIVHSHDAHEGFRTSALDKSERNLALHYAAHVIFGPD